MKLKSSEPFWLVKNGLINSYPSLREDIETEILIVGGGITGSLIAHQCIAEGYQTTLIDRREIGHGSTSATTSMLQYEIDVPLYQLIEMIGEEGAVKSYRACYESIDDLLRIVDDIQSDCGFSKKDSLYFAARKKDVSWLKREFEARKKHGFGVAWLEAEEISLNYGLRHTYGGILSKQGGSVDAFRLTHDLLAFNSRRGLSVYDKTDISRVTHELGGSIVVDQYGNMIKADRVVYCNGFESAEIIKDDFVRLISTYAIVTEVVDGSRQQLDKTLFWSSDNPYVYLRSTDDGRILIGGEDSEFVSAVKSEKVLYAKSVRLLDRLNRLLPSNNFRTDFAWTGVFGETKDGLPYIGAHPGFPGAYFVLGFGGNGITFSVIGMDMIADMLKDREHPLAEYFRFGR